MFQTLVNAWKIPDLRKKLLFTAFIILLYRIGSNIPVPFIDMPATGLIDPAGGTTFLNYLSMMTGDAFNYGTIFALSITPYINSSIIIQLLTVAIPYLERLSKEGEEGRKKIAKITRYVTIALGLLQSTAYFIYLNAKKYVLYTGDNTFVQVFQALVIIFVLTAGTALVMWLGEQINDKGIGNGISIILFAGIISRIPTEASMLFSTNPQVGSYFSRGGIYYFLEKRKVESLQEIERKDTPIATTSTKESSTGKLSYEQKKEQEKILRKLRKAVETIEAELADIEAKIAAYDEKFATATEYNEADYAAYNDLKAQYDKQMHEWEKASYELEITENQ